jgi:hypothetical protein
LNSHVGAAAPQQQAPALKPRAKGNKRPAADVFLDEAEGVEDDGYSARGTFATTTSSSTDGSTAVRNI